MLRFFLVLYIYMCVCVLLVLLLLAVALLMQLARWQSFCPPHQILGPYLYQLNVNINAKNHYNIIWRAKKIDLFSTFAYLPIRMAWKKLNRCQCNWYRTHALLHSYTHNRKKFIQFIAFYIHSILFPSDTLDVCVWYGVFFTHNSSV